MSRYSVKSKILANSTFQKTRTHCAFLRPPSALFRKKLLRVRRR